MSYPEKGAKYKHEPAWFERLKRDGGGGAGNSDDTSAAPASTDDSANYTPPPYTLDQADRWDKPLRVRTNVEFMSNLSPEERDAARTLKTDKYNFNKNTGHGIFDKNYDGQDWNGILNSAVNNPMRRGGRARKSK